MRAQEVEAAAGDLRIGVFHGGDDARDSCSDDAFDAWSRAAFVRARLERGVQRGAVRAWAGHVQRNDFGVRPASREVRALTGNNPLGRDNHGAHNRVGTGTPPPALGEKERAIHQRDVVDHLSVKSASTYAPASNGTRSSIASPTPRYRIGSFNSCAIATATPPLAVPSSLVRTMPFAPLAVMNSRAWTSPF